MPGARPLLSPPAAGLAALGRLPERLLAAADGSRWASALRGAVPELMGGTWTLGRCEPRLRLKDGGWAVSCRLSLTDQGGGTRDVLVTGSCRPGSQAPDEPATVTGALGTLGWRATIPALGLSLEGGSEDVGLPALAELIDAERARPMLSAALAVPIDACEPEVMRYKAGSRCTVRYRLSYPAGISGPETVIAKTYRGDKGANAHAGMTALEQAGIPDDAVALAPVLGYDAQRRVLLQGAVPEECTLKELARRFGATGDGAVLVALEDGVVRAARGLAALHASGVRHGEVVGWEDEHAELCELVERLAPFAPELDGALRSWLDDVAAMAGRHPADAVGPAHRSFRPAQVLLGGGGVAFIDFDGLCTAEPALDVALFRSSLRNATLQATPATELGARLVVIDDVADRFVDEYRSCRPVSLARVRLWERLYLVTSVLHCWTKLQPGRLPGRMAALRAHVEDPLG